MEQIAIIHFTNYPKGQDRSCMAAVMKYTAQEKKTLWQGRRLVSGVNCRPESVYDDFLRTKLLYHKESGTMFYHMVQSFPAGEDADPAVVHAAALKLAEWFEGREVLACTHVDRDHIHSHFLINSVSFEDGKKLHISEPELTGLRQRSDQVCMEFGLPVFRPQKRKRVKSVSGAEYHAAARGESWKFRLMNTIDECMRCRDDRLHDEKYWKERMELEFRIRQAAIHGRAAQAEYDQAPAGGGAAPHGGGMVGADRRADGAGKSPGGADPSAGRDIRKTQSLDDTGADGGAGPGGEGNPADAGTGWEEERAALFSAASSAAQSLAGVAVRSDAPTGTAGAVVRLGHALERVGDDAPMRDAAHPHTDRKTLSRERQKKIALGHKEDDHEEQQTWQQTM